MKITTVSMYEMIELNILVFTRCQFRPVLKLSTQCNFTDFLYVVCRFFKNTFLTRNATITTAADDKFFDIFPNFRKKYASFVIFEKTNSKI